MLCRCASRVELEPLVDGYDSPEGPAFAPDGALFFVNWLSSSIVRLAPDGPAEEWFNTGGIPAGLAFHRDGSLYVADEGDQIHGDPRGLDRQRQSRPGRQPAPRPAAQRRQRPRLRPRRVLYFSDPWGSSRDNPIGGFYRLFPDGRLEQLDSGLAFPNGVAVDATPRLPRRDGPQPRPPLRPRARRRDRPARAVVPARRRDRARTAWPSTPRATSTSPTSGPGGSTWSTRAGVVFDQIPVPGSKPTNVAFGGPDGPHAGRDRGRDRLGLPGPRARARRAPVVAGSEPARRPGRDRDRRGLRDRPRDRPALRGRGRRRRRSST